MPHSMSDLRLALTSLPPPSIDVPPLSSYSDNFLKALLQRWSLTHLAPDEVAGKLGGVYEDLGAKWLVYKEENLFDEKNHAKEVKNKLSDSLISTFFPTEDDANDKGQDGGAENSSSTYSLTIPSEMLGLTVENVLERTIIRTVIPHGAASLAGAKIGSLIVSVGSRVCQGLTHFETIDELRQSQRPLKLVLREVSDAVLKEGRNEMVRLINVKSDSASSPSSQSTCRSLSITFVDLLLQICIGYTACDNVSSSLSLGKVLKDYIKRCVDSQKEMAANDSTASNDANGTKDGNDTNDSIATFHQGSTISIINESIQRGMSLLSDFSTHSPIRCVAGVMTDFLVLCLEIVDDNAEKGKNNKSSPTSPTNHKTSSSTSPQYDIEDNDQTESLSPAGNLLKLLLRHVCNNECSEATNPNFLLQIIHRLAGSTSELSRKVGVSLTPILWKSVDFHHHLQLRGIVTRSLHDVEQSVRSATGRVLMEIVEMMDDSGSTTPWLVLMCERGMTDPVGELRGNAVGLVCALCEGCKRQKLAAVNKAEVAENSKGSDSSSELFMDIYLLQCKLLPIATRLAEDKSPNVRLAVASQTDRLMSALGSHWLMVLVDLFQALLQDSDEKVRSEAVYCIPRLIATIIDGDDVEGSGRSGSQDLQTETLSSLLNTMSRMLSDSSVGVRVSLATSAGQLLVLISRNDHSNVDEDGRSSFGNLTLTSSDSSPNRSGAAAAVSAATTQVSPHMHFVDEAILPLVQKLLHDPDPSVCSNALRAVANASQSLSKAGGDDGSADGEGSVDFVPVLKEKQVLRLLPTLTHLSSNEKWRVRRSAVEVVPALVKSTVGMKARAEIGKLVVELLSDPVAEVRKSAAFSLCVASSSSGASSSGGKKKPAGDDWLDAIVMPHLQACIVSQNFRQRLVALDMLRTLIDTQFDSGRGVARGKGGKILDFIALAFGMRKDTLPNVRLNSSRVFCDVPLKEILAAIAAAGSGGNEKEREKEREQAEKLEAEIVAGLNELLENDKDSDVFYFTSLALSKLAAAA